MRIGPEWRPVGEMRKRKKTFKKGKQKSQNRAVAPLCGGAPCEPIPTKVGVFVGMADFITYIENGFNIFIGFSWPTDGKTLVSL